MAYECLDKSPIVTVGQTFVTKFGNIRLIKVYDSGSGQIGVKPIGWTNEVIITTFDSRVETIGPVTVKTNFFTLAGRGAHFWVCGEIEEIDPLRISAITVYKVTDPDMVIADVLVNGEGSGTLSISWGDLGTTTHTINGAGQYYFEKSLPVGTHNICGSIGTTQECATIIIGEPDLDILWITAITVYEVADPDMVIADVLVNGEGSGTLSISWGDLGTTTHTINGAGQYYFEKSLPVGTHNICGSIGTTQECATIIISEPDLDILWITAITVYEVADPDMVIADVLVNGEGSGTLSISWGDLGTTTHTINGAGQYYFEKSLPVGTHNICGSIGTTQECATIIISEPDLDPDLGTCPYCTTKELQNLKISEFKPDRQVPAGNQYAITVMIHDISVLYGDYVCLCLHDRDTLDLLYSSGAVKIGANEYLPFQISGQMPDKDLKLKLSVIDDNVWPLSDDCEDFRDFTISVGEYKPPLEDEDYLMYVGLAVIVALGIYMIARR